MRHAVLGAGGVGAFLAAALARARRDVLLLMRDESLAGYDGVVHVESAILGDFEAALPTAPTLERPVDALWVTTKATQLADALERVPADAARGAVVVPLLNGLDHVEVLRRRFGTVLPAAIVIESERVRPGFVRQLSSFASIQLSPGPRAERVRSELEDAGLSVSIGESEADVLWRKLAVLAPIALTTTLRGSTPTRSSLGSRACRLDCGRRCRRIGKRTGRWRSTRSEVPFSARPSATGSRRRRRARSSTGSVPASATD
jgi:2-dehydropantoate 2-reductase